MLTCQFVQVLTPADDIHHINKHNFKVPFVCGCRDLGEALRRIAEGAAMIRTKGEAGTGNVVEAVRHTRAVTGAIRQLQTLDDDELYVYAKEIRAPVDLVRKVKHLGRSVTTISGQHRFHAVHKFQNSMCRVQAHQKFVTHTLVCSHMYTCHVLLDLMYCSSSTCGYRGLCG